MLISLSPSGDLRLSTEDGKYSIDLPPSSGGLKMIISILQSQADGAYKLATKAAPTQWEIDRLNFQVNELMAKRRADRFGDLSQMELDL